MKWFRLIGVVGLLLIATLGCQLFSPKAPAATETASSGGEGYPPPYPSLEYPPPVVNVEPQSPPAADGGMIYPNLKDGDTIEWYQAVDTLYNGQVSKVTQSPDLNVFLTLKDGRTLKTVEPEIDDVVKLIAACGEACKDIVVATE